MRTLFWTAFGMDVAALLYLLAMLYTSGSPWADLVMIPLLMLLSALPMVAFGFAVSKDGNARILCLLLVTMGAVCLALPVTMVLTEQTRGKDARPMDGLALALRTGNVKGVRELAPGAADVNRFYAEASRFLAGPEGDEMNRRAMVEAILEAGADANYAEGELAPVWWTWIHRDGHRVEDVETIRLLLKRGVDVKKRARGEGPVTVAVRRECWETAVLLLEAGAEWPREAEKGVREALAKVTYGKQLVPAALAKLQARIEDAR